MIDEPETSQLAPMSLQRFTGEGRLRCQHNGKWDCAFTIARLLNGRLQVSVVLDVKLGSSRQLRDWLRRCEPFRIEGADGDGNPILAADIHFTRVVLGPQETLVGYAHSCDRVNGREQQPNADTITIACELGGFRCTSPTVCPFAFQIQGLSLEIGRLGRNWRVDEHSNAYKHMRITSYLQVREVPAVEEHRALESVRGMLQLLSIAQRRYVLSTAQHKYRTDEQWLESQFHEPAFTSRGWPRPLIPVESLESFLTAAYPNLTAKYQSLELGNVIDHYLQALTLRSVWPSSLGVFTAMETLRAAFFRQSTDIKDREFQYWIVPGDTSSREPWLLPGTVVEDLFRVLKSHCSRFDGLRRPERQSLRAQLRGLNRRSYKTQLRRMLNQFGVEYAEKELQPFIDIRNRIIHYGTPAPATTSVTHYRQRATRASQHISNATSLFERTLLAALGYEGPRELFNAEEGRITLDTDD